MAAEEVRPGNIEMPVPCRELQSRGRVGHLPLLDRCSVVSAAPPTLTGRESSGHHGMSESKSTAPGFRGLLRSVERPPLDGKEKKEEKGKLEFQSPRPGLWRNYAGRFAGDFAGSPRRSRHWLVKPGGCCHPGRSPVPVSHMLGGRGGDAGHHPRNLGAQA